jgi:general secretion pathway protein A
LGEIYYGRFYGFNSPPFHITPDPSLLFATETHQQALGAIEYGVAAGKGFIVITGEVGVGKTTMLRLCLDKLDLSKTKIIYLFNPALSVRELYATILEGLDVSLHGRQNSGHALGMLQRALLTAHKAGTQVILAVDEAQNMPEQTLESLRILSNLETAKSKLLQIILVGQPELDALLAKHSLRQLAQRVAVRARIKPLTLRQSCRYIQHRCQLAGRSGKRSLFTLPALWYLAVIAHGIPRTINICCDNALINGYGHGANRISLNIARESHRALQFRPPFQRVAMLAIVGMVLVCIVFSSDALLRRFFTAPAPGNGLESSLRDRPALHQADVVRAPTIPSVANASLPLLPSVAEAPAQAPPARGPDAVQAAAIAAPIPAVVPAAAPAQTAAASATTELTDRLGRQPAWKWFVRRGDTVYKACRVTYGQCDKQALRALIAYNPQISINGVIRQGEVIVMPEHLESVQSN